MAQTMKLKIPNKSEVEKEFKLINTHVFIAGSGPIGCAFARTILDDHPSAHIWMAEIGAQDNPVRGAHHKNAIKYQKDIDSFVHVIQGALQPVSVPPASTYMPTLSESAWSPRPGETLISSFHNRSQVPEKNLPGCAVTRTVGGMSTHWTCACPEPHEDERKASPIKSELPELLGRAKTLLNVHPDEFKDSIRHNLVKGILTKKYTKERVHDLPLAVERNKHNKKFVTWSGANTVLGKEYAEGNNKRFKLHPEHKVIGIVFHGPDTSGLPIKGVLGAMVQDLKTNEYYLVQAKKYVIACGSVCTPQILWNSGFGDRGEGSIPELPALGRYLTEQSIAFCQVVLHREYIEEIEKSEFLPSHLKALCEAHKIAYKNDPIHIPFLDPEPQVTMPYTTEDEGKFEWHTQIHRDAFSYGDVGPRADPRLIVDLRFFGRQDPNPNNRIKFEDCTDIYGMPQATFEVNRSPEDVKRDQRMMLAMCEAANELGGYLPGSYPQFMAPGLALHITGTTRVGATAEDSVANANSQLHGHEDIYVGGNGVIPDSTACNPTLTSMAYAIKAARHIVSVLPADLPEP